MASRLIRLAGQLQISLLEANGKDLLDRSVWHCSGCGTILDVANMSLQTVESTEISPQERFHEALVERFARGQQPAAIAREIYPYDLDKRRKLRSKIWRVLQHDDRLAGRIQARAHAQMKMDLVPAVARAGQRAIRTGRADSVKLLAEMSGFHDPRVQHEHSGEIKIKLEVPRPNYDVDVADADVVEDAG